MTRKIKIAYIIDSIETPAAGTEKQLLMLLNEIDRTKFDPYLVCLHESKWIKKQSFSFPVKCFAFGSIASFDFLRNLRKMIKYFKNENFDIIQTFFTEGNMIGTFAARLAGCKAIVSSRRNIGYDHGAIHYAILRLLQFWTKYYLANSKAVADLTIQREGASPEKTVVIYNGMELDRFKNSLDELRKEQRAKWGIGADDILIGSIANLRPVKNIELLIRTASVLVKEYDNLKFVAVGDGPDTQKCQNLIESLDLSDKFILPGSYNDILPCLAAFDIAVMCSISESFSNSLIEYMAAGRPIVASNVGGNAEAITHRESGLIFELSDKKGLENSLRILIDDNGLAQKYAQTARRNALEKYSKKTNLNETERFYLDQVAQKVTSN